MAWPTTAQILPFGCGAMRWVGNGNAARIGVSASGYQEPHIVDDP
jgi:hypothetical protein